MGCEEASKRYEKRKRDFQYRSVYIYRNSSRSISFNFQYMYAEIWRLKLARIPRELLEPFALSHTRRHRGKKAKLIFEVFRCDVCKAKTMTTRQSQASGKQHNLGRILSAIAIIAVAPKQRDFQGNVRVCAEQIASSCISFSLLHKVETRSERDISRKNKIVASVLCRY